MGSVVGPGQNGRRPYAAFGHCLWDPNQRRLSVHGKTVKLPWRAAECLALLVEARCEVVTKEDLQNHIWGGALVEESSVARCINSIRKALDPAPDGGSHVETVPRIGYRLAVEVVDEPSAGATEPPRRRLPRWAFIAGGLAIVMAISGGSIAWIRADRKRQVDETIQRGLALLRRNDPTDGARANDMIRQAHDRIPGYPLAIAAMAEVAARRGRFSFEVSIDLARLAVTKDPNCGECQAIAGYVLMTRGWKWDEAGRRLERAIELDGSNTTRRIWYAEWLAIQNRLPEAVRQAEIAVRTAPTEPRTHTILAGVLYFSGRYQEAARAAEKATSLDERLQPAHYWAYRIAMVTGDDIGAIMARNRNLTGYHSRHEEEFYKNYFDDLKIYQKQGGRRAVVQAWLESVNEGPPLQVQRYARATWSMWIGEREKALTELEAAVESKPYHIIHVAVDPIFAPLRSEARFQEVVRRVGLRL